MNPHRGELIKPIYRVGFVHVGGFTSPSMGDGSRTGPTVTWMENAETVDVILVGSFIYKRIYLGELQK